MGACMKKNRNDQYRRKTTAFTFRRSKTWILWAMLKRFLYLSTDTEKVSHNVQNLSLCTGQDIYGGKKWSRLPTYTVYTFILKQVYIVEVLVTRGTMRVFIFYLGRTCRKQVGFAICLWYSTFVLQKYLLNKPADSWLRQSENSLYKNEREWKI